MPFKWIKGFCRDFIYHWQKTRKLTRNWPKKNLEKSMFPNCFVTSEFIFEMFVNVEFFVNRRWSQYKCVLISIDWIFFLCSFIKKDIKSYWTNDQCKEVYTSLKSKSPAIFVLYFCLHGIFRGARKKFSCGCSHIFWSTYTRIIRTTSSESRCQAKSQVVATVVFCSLHCQVLWLTSHSCFWSSVDIFCKTQNWNNILLWITGTVQAFHIQHYE